ncbi:flagellar export chaperone FlgN [Alteromonas sp. 1_MG-2023]|uniref:flagellar export chaperone FlgN n=1 Tax=Alteromonas sp. 1_MG-2023 TaxID=3062669 RepID=UPI0026E35CC3|nr:flagellar export chaperone FlgN [Alteromonas sp. 1_MG-2023]MDO6568474.1 flagellar export chaperone FlgN [Alteromonas sp. 1_MG-2023]
MTSNLHSALSQQVANLEGLGLLLEKELHLISSRDPETLINLLEEKSELLELIQATDQQVEGFYRQTSADAVSADEQGLMDKAKSLLDDCKYRTQINQKAVEQGQLRLTHLRNLMLEVRAKESLTYDKKGKPNAGRLGSGVSA